MGDGQTTNEETANETSRFRFLFFRLPQYNSAKINAAINLVFGFLFLILGAYVYSESLAMLYHEVDYTDTCSLGTNCTLPSFTITNPVEAPVFLKYKLRGFYQSSFEYQKATPMLKEADSVSSAMPENCNGFQTNAELERNVSVTGDFLDPNAPGIPCGFASAAMFSDEFALSIYGLRNYAISDEGIAWETDTQASFEEYNLQVQWIDLENEVYINWIRSSPFDRLSKTFGRINQNLQPGNHTLSVNVNWNSSKYGASTSVVLVETRFFGTRNTGFGIALIIFGVLGVALGMMQAAENARQRTLFTSSFN